jgi:IS5 family transposase
MKQQTFASSDFERFRKPTRREQFLVEMDKVVPWKQLCKLIQPHYPKAGNGRHPIGLERMLRIYFLQHWFNLSDPGAEEALYESRSMCRFAGIDLGREPVPDESTILGFRHLLERHELGEALFQAVGDYLHQRGLRIASGTIVDATIISAPSSTKNKDSGA